jgi:TolB protein
MDLKKWVTQRNVGIALIVLVGINAILAIYLVIKVSTKPTVTNEPVVPLESTSLPEATSTQHPLVTPTLVPVSAQGLSQTGAIILSMSDGEYFHLFAFHPQYLPFTRLTNGSWDDIDPVISPDGTRLAFSSRSNGHWDINILDLATGQLNQVTNSPEYDASPTWSSDGQWLAYGSSSNGQLQVFLRSLSDLTQAPIQLTDGPGINYSPSWSPGGREIAFVSTRSGEPEIWLAELDKVDERFTNLSQNSETSENHPVWSPDGSQLAWTSNNGNADTVFIWNSNFRSLPPKEGFTGSMPAWDRTGKMIASAVQNPNGTDLVVHDLDTNQLVVPQTNLPGSIKGISWMAGSQTGLLNLFLTAENMAPSPDLFITKPTQTPGPGGRKGVLPLKKVDAPYPFLQDLAIDSYEALRATVGRIAGWDFLAQLDNAYIPLTEPPEPGGSENWLFTGRGIAINSAPIQAGWMVVSREDFNGLPYWRVFIKALKQDGSQGAPLTQMIWDFTPRFQGDPIAYEEGGKQIDPPGGWWIDFTGIAQRYGWERLPAMSNWRTFYPGTRFNQFIYNGMVDWRNAMIELYPPEAIYTFTPIPTITQTPTRTPWKLSTKTPTRTRTPTPSPTRTATMNK